MMNNKTIGYIWVFLLIIFASIPTVAQDTKLPEGSALSLLLAKQVSSKDANRGDIVNFTVEKDVIIDGQTLIKQGTEAKGSVIYAEKVGYLGHSGKLAIQVESTTTIDGATIPLRAAKGGEGDSASGATITLSLLVGPFGLLKKGGDTIIKQGSAITVYTGEARQFRLDGATLVAVKPEIPVAASSEKVTVYIFRPKKFVGGALEPSVFCDGIDLARMDNGRYFMLKLVPGKHIVHMTDDKKGYELNMAAGHTYYFRVGVEAGMWKGIGKILLEDEAKGVKEVKKLKSLGADKIKDKSLVVAP